MSEDTLTGINDDLTRIREDHLAKNHCGYFKLWKMKLTEDGRSHHLQLPWIKDEVIGIFSTRQPCEAFLELIERGPEVSYEFHSFDRDIDHIRGHWNVSLDKEGVLHPNKNYRGESQNVKWEWTRHEITHEHGRPWGDTFSGMARTKARAIEMALASKTELEEFIRVERPKRAEGCSCKPHDGRLCGACQRQLQERRKKDCGCPHCEGTHD